MKTGESPRRSKPSQVWNEVQMPHCPAFSFMSKSASAVCATTPYQGSELSLHFSFSHSFFLVFLPFLCSAQPRLVHAPVLRDTQCSGLLSGQGCIHTYTPYLAMQVEMQVGAAMRCPGMYSVWHMLIIRVALARSVNSVLIYHLNILRANLTNHDTYGVKVNQIRTHVLDSNRNHYHYGVVLLLKIL